MKQEFKNRKVKIEIKARYGYGCHETKIISLFPESLKYPYDLTMSKRMYNKYVNLLCAAGSDSLVQVDLNSDYVINVRDQYGNLIGVF